jgi:VIT1/CCC1 family predicted Fe2+/Mn2+ transporter
MATGKVEIKVGALSFLGEGDGTWVSEQLDKVLKNITSLTTAAAGARTDTGGTVGLHRGESERTTLAIFLKRTNATSKQIRKFLATAIWLTDRTGKKQLVTSDVSRALTENQQTRLTNPTECLNQNIRKGFCEKAGKEFYVTDQGHNEIK